MQGTEALTATASDVGSGLASLAISYRPAGGSWTTLCSGATSPRTCNLNTVPLADGSYELRASATDVAGNVRDTLLTRTVDNIAPTVSVVPPAGALSGIASFTMNAADAGTGVTTVTAEFRPMAGGAWSQVCVDSAAPWACTGLDTTQAPDGLYEARATAVDGAGHSTTSASVTNIRIDNTAPSSATVTDPGTPFGGSKAISGTAADAGSGIASWTLQYRTSPAGTWTDACSDTSASYSCSWVTTGVADGLYDLRAIARDGAGNQTTSATVASRRVDNTAPAVALADPGTPMTGTKALTATATDAVGVASVSFQRSPAGAGTWTQICLDATTAYTCSFDTTAVTDGSYDMRAVATRHGRQPVDLDGRGAGGRQPAARRRRPDRQRRRRDGRPAADRRHDQPHVERADPARLGARRMDRRLAGDPRLGRQQRHATTRWTSSPRRARPGCRSSSARPTCRSAATS